jgi:FkbM family methyltransferase
VKAWRLACHRAGRIPRFTPGSIRLMGYDLHYADLLTLCPQWHELFVREILKFRCAKTAPRILDCGANIGLASLYFKRLYPQARVSAYEADPEVHAILCENLRNNGASDVEAIHAAIWTQNGEISFRCEGADSGTIETFADGLRGPTREVPALRLRDLLHRDPVDLLKLDIEGAELDVLADCGDALANVSALLLDLHELRPEQRVTARLLDLLRDAGFTTALDDLNTLPWRPPSAGADTPFPGRPLAWVVQLWAWRD